MSELVPLVIEDPYFYQENKGSPINYIKAKPTAENIFVISDTHFGHANIVRYCNRPLDWEETFFNSWYKRVTKDSVIFHLGDMIFPSKGMKAVFKPKLKGLFGEKYLVRGNHDKENDRAYYNDYGFSVVNPFIMNVMELPCCQELDIDYLEFTHEPLTFTRNRYLNIHGHAHNNPIPNEFCPGPYDPTKQVNVSIEVMDYKMWTIKEILGRWKKTL